MTVMERLANSVVVPVVVLDKVEDAVPLAKAMAAGGVATGEQEHRLPLPEAGRGPGPALPALLIVFSGTEVPDFFRPGRKISNYW